MKYFVYYIAMSLFIAFMMTFGIASFVLFIFPWNLPHEIVLPLRIVFLFLFTIIALINVD